MLSLVPFLVLQSSLFVFLVSCVCWCSVAHVPWVGLQCVIVVFPGHTHFVSVPYCLYTLFARNKIRCTGDNT